jgi:light-independent protochlorophyllide reductase subunit B
VQDFPARYSPQMGFEGANVIFDSWVHPLMMGLEEHLLAMFRDDFEFHDEALPSHLGRTPTVQTRPPENAKPSRVGTRQSDADRIAAAPPAGPIAWAAEAQKELHKIPFFVRGKARRNTELYAHERGVALITVETLYDAKAHFGR